VWSVEKKRVFGRVKVERPDSPAPIPDFDGAREGAERRCALPTRWEGRVSGAGTAKLSKTLACGTRRFCSFLERKRRKLFPASRGRGNRIKGGGEPVSHYSVSNRRRRCVEKNTGVDRTSCYIRDGGFGERRRGGGGPFSIEEV